MTPKGNHFLTLDKIFDKKGNAIAVAPGDGHIVYIPFDGFDINLALMLRFL
jgi:putative protease